MWRVSRACACLAFTAGFLGACGTAQKSCRSSYTAPATGSRPFLWQVTGPSGSLVLFGTHHGAASDDIPEAAWRALEAAQVFVSEVEEVDSMPLYKRDDDDLAKAFFLREGQSLQKMLSTDDFMELQWLLDTSAEALSRLKPWAALFRLLARMQTLPHPNMPQALAEGVEERGVPREFLTAWTEQVTFLDTSVGPAKLANAIHDRDNISCRLTDAVTAYRAGDDAFFADDISGPGDPIVPRLEGWAQKIEEYLKSGRKAFVSVGVANTLGPYGLTTLLARRGYQVTRL